MICMLSVIETDAQIITTVAGCGCWGSIGDGGAATAASFGYFGGIAVDKEGNLYIADGNNNRVRRVDFVTNIITTIAGNGTPGFSGDGGAATSAQLNNPEWVCVDSSNNIYITDAGNIRIRKVDSLGVISTFAGNGLPGFSGDGGSATNASIYGPQGVCVDAFGDVYLVDGANPRIRKVNSAGLISTIAGTGVAAPSSVPAAAVAAPYADSAPA